jgi:hypothetical protein
VPVCAVVELDGVELLGAFLVVCGVLGFELACADAAKESTDSKSALKITFFMILIF